MLNKASEPFQKSVFWFTGIVTLVSLLLGWVAESYYFFLVPFFLLLCYVSVADFKIVFYLLVGLIPLSIEYEFPNGMGTDLPTEPIMVGLMLIFFAYILGKRNAIDPAFIRHPIITVLFFH